MSKAININVNEFKYRSIILRILSPYLSIKAAIRKNLAERLIIDAAINIGNEISNAPADIVNILYGIGENPAVKIIMNP